MMDMITRLKTEERFNAAAFVKPDALLQPAYTWVWNAPLDREEICRQLDDMARAGIRCAYVLPEPKEFRSYNQVYHMAQEYLSDDFFEAVRFAAGEALSRGIQFWLYDEGGWPSGNACGRILKKRPELAFKSVETRTVALRPGETYCPGENALAAFVEGMRNLVEPGFAADRETVLTEYFVKNHPRVDPLDDELGAEFVRSTHDGYARFFCDLFGAKDEKGAFLPGSGRIQMMFTDEPGAGRRPWPRGFEQRFVERFGYDLRLFLPTLFDDEEEVSGADMMARMDYHLLTGEMFRENYFVPLHDWCRENNLLSTGHLDMDHVTDQCLWHHYGNPMALLRELDVPGVDAIWQQITLPRPGMGDRACFEGNGFFPRFASSAARQTGGRFALSESFAVYGAGLTGDEMKYVLNHQLARGINVFNFMVASCGSESCVPLVMRPNFTPQMPGYAHLGAVNDYTARAGYLMQLGEAGGDTALYLPLRDLWVSGQTCRDAAAAFDKLGQELEARQIDFDILDDDAIRKAHWEGGALCVGAARYRHIAIPACRHMPEEVRELLARLSPHPVPAVSCDNPNLRARTRMLSDGGTLFMLFNESGGDQAMRICLPGSGPVYRLYAENGRIEAVDTPSELLMHAGEARFYLRAGKAVEGAAKPFSGGRLIAETGHFTLRRVRQTVITQEGLVAYGIDEPAQSMPLGSWADVLGSDFSGEAVYTAQIELHEPLAAEKRYLLDLGKVECSARVTLGGRELGVLFAHPMRLEFDGTAFAGQKKLILEIEVANTMANVCNATPISDLFTPDQLGFYHEKISAFERLASGGGLYGPVRLYEEG